MKVSDAVMDHAAGHVRSPSTPPSVLSFQFQSPAAVVALVRVSSPASSERATVNPDGKPWMVAFALPVPWPKML
jgi:hypothetical protein